MGKYTNLYNYLLNGLRLPVAILRDGKPTDTARFKTVSSFMAEASEPFAIPRESSPGGIQYLCNNYFECFICACLSDGYEMWIGPVLTETVTSNMVSELIRKYKWPIRQQSRLTDYYNALPLLSDNEYFYAGQIAFNILKDEDEIRGLPPARSEHASVPVLSARREAEHRLALFEHPPYFMELEMTRLVTTGDVQHALDAMTRINTFNRARLAHDPIRSVKNSLICNCTFLARAAIAGGVSPEDAFSLSDKLILEAEDTHSYEMLEALERRILIEFVELVHIYNNSHYSKPIRDVVRYIHEHLSEKINLRQLAESVFLHPNYLCALFKKETGVTFVQYVLRRRIEEAKFFLRYTGNPIVDIAVFYQFSTQSYFIRCFKEVVGQTPLQYRNNSEG